MCLKGHKSMQKQLSLGWCHPVHAPAGLDRRYSVNALWAVCSLRCCFHHQHPNKPPVGQRVPGISKNVQCVCRDLKGAQGKAELKCFLVHPFSLSLSLSIAFCLPPDIHSFSQNPPRASVTANYDIKLSTAAICTWTPLPQIMHANRWKVQHDSLLGFTAPRPL